jgi:hypothetical protein
MSFVEIIHRAIEDVPVLARFAIFMALIAIIPQLSDHRAALAAISDPP